MLETAVLERQDEPSLSSNIFSLNPPQLEAVLTFDRPLLVLAGAGSGKTRVITAKIAEIISSGRAMSFQILAVTFTNKAANEMVERVRHFCGIEASQINIGTFHSICVKILRQCANLVGFGNNFLIADTSDQKKIIKDIITEMGMDAKAFPPSVISSFISRVKEKFLSPHELTASLSHFPNIYREIRLDKIYEEYQSRLHSQNMMDFDDLLFFTTRILTENELVLEQYRDRFKYILIDEYQDINALQSRWFRLLAGSNQNICVVGDDDQSIYGWRGADVSIILSFAKDFKNAQVIKLEQNYRSTQNIISVAEKIISNNKNRLGKNLFTEEVEGEKVEITCYSDSKIEARETVSRIENIKKREGRNFTDFAILVRASSQTRILEEAFIALSIPYKIIGGLKFYERREIKDILSYIKVINGTADDIAMERVLKTPKKGIGETSIDKLVEYAKKRQVSLMQACFDLTGDDPFAETGIVGVKAFSILTNFFGLIKKWRENGKAGMREFIAEIVRMIEEIRYIEFLKEEDEDQIDARSANINELLNSMQGFETVDAFLEHISLISSADDAGIEGEDAVKMLTIHTAKGLEFPVVFLPGWEEGLFPSAKTLDEGGEIGIEEERRLAYVAITRARERLFLSHTKMRMIYGGFNPTRESMFIAEIKHSNAVSYRDKSIGSASATFGINYGRNYEMSGERFRAGSFSEEIKNVKKLDLIEVGVIVKHKIFGFGKVSKKVSPNLFEVIFDEDLERKTIRNDFLTFVKKE
jgi:DNA helicase-2/ATP-dependent DNA helicase PcrA